MLRMPFASWWEVPVYVSNSSTQINGAAPSQTLQISPSLRRISHQQLNYTLSRTICPELNLVATLISGTAIPWLGKTILPHVLKMECEKNLINIIENCHNLPF